jgi:hypothetical protein
MAGIPKAVVHVNFLPTVLVFDARPVWAAVLRASREKRLPADAMERISGAWGSTAIHLATRDGIMRVAVRELKAGMSTLCDLIPVNLSLDSLRQLPPLNGKDADKARDHVLFAIDSFLYEFRAFLELLAKFCYGVLTDIGKEPAQKQRLSSGREVTIKNRHGKIQAHDFLVYLCDQLKVPILWYEFLTKHRNFFTHEGAPYCAVEHLLVAPPEYDLLIMKTNILDFSAASPDAYFRVSDCAAVLEGVHQLAGSAQLYLIETIDGLPLPASSIGLP